MPDYLSVLAALGASLLVLVAVAWAVVLVLLLRGSRSGSTAGRTGRTLSGLPRQRQAAPHVESVELTPAEQDAFAGLVRQLGRH
ncbi:hypothetical protein ACWD5R_36580 [Streptomyces sp. NPDC002514]|uniref:hypothetical protein n=1 Tax=Streptomyces sp. NPDC001270 TaxID=3364554 RepID=UPI00367D9855